jgi:hypothetical protein
MAMPVIDNGAAPTFVNVTAWAPLVVPVGILPKSRLLALSFTAGNEVPPLSGVAISAWI